MLILILAFAIVLYLIIRRNQSSMYALVGKYQEGYTYKTLTGLLYPTCKEDCDKDSNCAGFVFSNENNIGTCEMKSKLPNITDRQGYMLYRKK